MTIFEEASKLDAVEFQRSVGVSLDIFLLYQRLSYISETGSTI